jgi:hypothetical protein
VQPCQVFSTAALQLPETLTIVELAVIKPSRAYAMVNDTALERQPIAPRNQRRAPREGNRLPSPRSEGGVAGVPLQPRPGSAVVLAVVVGGAGTPPHPDANVRVEQTRFEPCWMNSGQLLEHCPPGA